MAGKFQFLDPERPVTITRGHLPHWDQEGATYFITWRLADSIPAEKWKEWNQGRSLWLRNHGIDGCAQDWQRNFEALPKQQRQEYARTFTRQAESEMDQGHGACVLRSAVAARIVADSLQHFNGDRYEMGDFVIMPNHVHLLVGKLGRETMLKQVESWKKWTALQINEILGRRGRLWQDESFDHLVRNEMAFEKLRRYIAENPRKARLKNGEFVYWRRPDDQTAV